jgi:hypothetical protein
MELLQNPILFREIAVEEQVICRYLDRLDKLGLPVQRELLRGAADYILLANWTPASTDEKPPSVGQHWVSRFLQQYPEYTLKPQKSPIWSANRQRVLREPAKLVSIASGRDYEFWN